MGSIGANKSTPSRPDEFGGALGERGKQEDIGKLLTKMRDGNIINPNYMDSKTGRANTEDNEVMIRKSDGKRISMTEYIATTKDSSTPKKIKF